MKNLLLFLFCITLFACTEPIKTVPENELSYGTVTTLKQLEDSCHTAILINNENCNIKTTKGEYYVIKQYDPGGYIFAFLLGALVAVIIIIIVIRD